MKFFILVFGLIGSMACSAQENSPNISLKWAPLGLIPGNISLHGEYNFGKNSLTAKIGIPLSTERSIEYDDKDALFHMKTTSFMAGYRTYLSKRHMKGFYFEPFFKYVHHSSEGTGNAVINSQTVAMDFINNYDGIGIGAQLGVQFLIKKRVVIDLFFLGPEINAARNKFRSIETTDAIPWTQVEASEAEQDIREFIDRFPFIRNKVGVMVDRENKTVTADFKGALPGLRTGISIGIAL
jgi:hypothetical protein